MSAPEFVFEKLGVERLDEVFALEAEGFPADEKATKESLEFRLTKAGDFFYGAINPQTSRVLGYVCGTLAEGEELAHEAMSNHIPTGESICVHSVVVATSEQKRGIGQEMMVRYAAVMKQNPQVKRGYLLCKDKLRHWYEKAGWEFVRVSPVVHGQERWLEMKIDFSEQK
eukprot:CAMPEP_0201487656 /NCGR_PEP_ID=MMETSP0151_2-20130828/14675_1 /ASSEMBLY_ACC=CAM_ASM_000257 /TAXON_ID=200890 /ORGANISM="Paramoeba atlantica, Strain 621/1 / CCAP 1560/9" /LENGTH=169 /DNA_ID=CAMNT_0047872763 /DNA_START=6 /DNA_END=515 /DNA_ORIENTATION=-